MIFTLSYVICPEEDRDKKYAYNLKLAQLRWTGYVIILKIPDERPLKKILYGGKALQRQPEK